MTSELIRFMDEARDFVFKCPKRSKSKFKEILTYVHI